MSDPIRETELFGQPLTADERAAFGRLGDRLRLERREYRPMTARTATLSVNAASPSRAERIARMETARHYSILSVDAAILSPEQKLDSEVALYETSSFGPNTTYLVKVTVDRDSFRVAR